jgi:hypothetical protein
MDEARGREIRPRQAAPWSNEAPLLRKGAQGGWNEALTVEMARRIDAHCREELHGLGCNFPYDDTFMIAAA